MPIPSPTISKDSLAVVSSAVLFALLDTFIAKGILERGEIQEVLKNAKLCVGARATTFYGPEASELMNALCKHFA
jgi:hypothetical protein